MRCRALGVLFSLGMASCTPYGAPKAVGAATFAATAVAATGAKRKVAGGCWANCSKGWHCDQKRGLCVEDEERTARPAVTFTPAPPSQPECQPPLRCDPAPER